MEWVVTPLPPPYAALPAGLQSQAPSPPACSIALDTHLQAPAPVPQPVPTWGAAGGGPEGDAENQEPCGDDDLPMAQVWVPPLGGGQTANARLVRARSRTMC